MSSDQSAVYVHMSGKDVDDALLRINGIEKSKEKENGFELIECTRCDFKNHPGAKICNRCGLALDLKFVLEKDQGKETIKDKLNVITDELSKSPDVVDMMLKAIMVLKAEKGLHNGDLKRSSPRIE